MARAAIVQREIAEEGMKKKTRRAPRPRPNIALVQRAKKTEYGVDHAVITASHAYPEDYVARADCGEDGDGLARWIATEIRSVWDTSEGGSAQFKAVAEYLRRGAQEIMCCAAALEREAMEAHIHANL